MKQFIQSIFVEYFGSSPYVKNRGFLSTSKIQICEDFLSVKVLDFLIQGQEFDYSMTEVARGSRVGWSAFTSIWEKLLEKNIILATRTIGNAKLFKLNKENLFVKKIIKLDLELTKAETDKLLVDA